MERRHSALHLVCVVADPQSPWRQMAPGVGPAARVPKRRIVRLENSKFRTCA